ncbi:hypothetical protein EX30DRAFT_235221 [Ascodesmis nigricans]|uniref:Uncharacterized protein n=1 Tax=Ascodesmis nigricans TaxID=341454 RepID=A0A4S2MYR5_9PEZI|nr:hypothetical protein EX30DRAFT_235221 [Ascodesmis nigricans]
MREFCPTQQKYKVASAWSVTASGSCDALFASLGTGMALSRIQMGVEGISSTTRATAPCQSEVISVATLSPTTMMMMMMMMMLLLLLLPVMGHRRGAACGTAVGKAEPKTWNKAVPSVRQHP